MSMIIASMALLPADSASAVPNGKHIIVEVKDGANHLAGATVVLSDPYGRIPSVSALTGSDGNATFIAMQGMYQLRVNATNYYDYQMPGTFRVDGLQDIRAPVVLEQLGTLGQVTFNMTDGMIAVTDPSILLQSETHGAATTDFSAHGTSGNVTLNIPTGTYRMIAKASGYRTNVSNITVVVLSSTLHVNMSATTHYNYTVKVSFGNGVLNNLKGFLVLKNGTGVDPAARIVEGRTFNQNISFDAMPETYVLLVSADLGKTYQSEVKIVGTALDDITMLMRTSMQYDTRMSFYANDWNHLSINDSHTLAFDSPVPGLPYSSIPSMRIQAELAYGNGDGVLNTAEMARYGQAIASLGPYQVSTVDLLQVNSESYLSIPGTTSVIMSGITGPVNSTLPVTMSIIDDYNVNGAQIALGASSYNVNVDVEYNTAAISYTYWISPPSPYEITTGATVNSPSRLAIQGNLNVSIISTMKINGDPTNPSAIMVYQRSVGPIAIGAVTGPASYCYYVSVNATYDYYIVANNSEMIFSSAGSYDPNLNPLTYIWNFGDGTANVTSTASSVRHTFTQATYYRNVTLMVKDIANLTSSARINVKVDDQKPIPVITQDGVAITTIYANQKQTLSFGQSLTTDYITGPSDPTHGAIHQYRWNFGDGTNPVTILPSALQNVTHAFSKAGTFTVWLNVTDSVGHVGSRSMTAIVNDTEAPVPRMSAEIDNIDQGTIAMERTMLTFNATASTDNSGSISSFLWDFGDGTTGDGIYVNHTFSIAGAYKVKLVATDANGNEGNITKSFTVLYGPRPDLRTLSITVDPTSYAAGDKVIVRLNLINVGNSTATGMYAVFYLIDLSGGRQEIGNSSQLYVNGMTTDHLGPGETGYISLNCTFATDGAFNLEAVAYSVDEVKSVDNTAKQSLTVGEPGSILPMVAIVIALVVIVAAVLFVFRKRIFKIKK
jgi:PKD repeat protein